MDGLIDRENRIIFAGQGRRAPGMANCSDVARAEIIRKAAYISAQARRRAWGMTELVDC